MEGFKRKGAGPDHQGSGGGRGNQTKKPQLTCRTDLQSMLGSKPASASSDCPGSAPESRTPGGGCLSTLAGGLCPLCQRRDCKGHVFCWSCRAYIRSLSGA